jgi:hypothetical protein
MKTRLGELAILYTLIALWAALDPSHFSNVKYLAVYVFLLPGVVALVAHLELRELAKQRKD